MTTIRMALIRADGEVVNLMVVASGNTAWAREVAARLGCTAREIVTERETPITEDAIVSRSCEPGVRLIVRREGGRDVEDFERAPVEEGPRG